MKLAFRDLPLDSFAAAFKHARSIGHPGRSASGTDLPPGQSMALGPVDGLSLRLRHLHGGGTLLTAEGPLSAAVECDDGLVPQRHLGEAMRHAARVSRSLGLPLNPWKFPRAWKTATVARIDLATDVRFETPADAQDFLRAVDCLRLAGLESLRYSGADCAPIRSVVFQRATARGRRIQFRVYDRDAEQGQAQIGRTIRIERQIEPRRRDQHTVIAARSIGYATQLWPASWALESNVVRRPADLGQFIAERVGTLWPDDCGHDDQILNEAVAFRLIGAALRYSDVGDAAWGDKRKATRGRRELRGLGLAVGTPDDSPYDLGAVFRAVAEAWAEPSGARRG